MSWLRRILAALRPANQSPAPSLALAPLEPPSPPPHVPNAYKRDEYDLLLAQAADMLAFAGCVESIYVSEMYQGGKIVGYLPPRNFLAFTQSQTVRALDNMLEGVYRDGQPIDRDYLTLLARIGTPNLWHSVDPSGRRKTQFWPRADRQATRPDLLHFYLLVKLKYLTLKAEMQNRVPTPEELADLAEIAELHIRLHPSTPMSPESLRADLLQSWRQA